MPFLTVTVFKTTERFDIEYSWQNKWTLATPYDHKSDSARLLALKVAELERQIHFNSVKFAAVTVHDDMQPGSPDEGAGRVFIPLGNSSLGFQQTPENPADMLHVLKVAKYPTRGRNGHFWFLGCIDSAQVKQQLNGSLHLENYGFYNHIIGNWLPGLVNDHAAQLVVRLGVNRFGTPIDRAPVNLLFCTGVTLRKGIARARVKKPPKGVEVKEPLDEVITHFGLWLHQVNEWHAFNQNFVPVEIRDNTITILGEVKAIANKVQSYVDGGQPQDETATPASFRWSPVGEELTQIASKIKSEMETDIEQIQQMQPYVFAPDGQEYMTHEQADDIKNRLVKYEGWLAEFAPADWINTNVTASTT